MKMLFNGEELANIVTEKSTLGSALAAVQNQKIGPDDVISQIWIDGEPLTAERLADWKTRPACEFAETRIEVLPRKQMVSIGLRTIRQGLSESSELRSTVVAALRQGQIDRAMGFLSKYLSLWNTTQQSITSACRIMDCDLETLYIADSGQPLDVSGHIGSLTERLQNVKAALESGDYVLLADLLDYEFEDLTASWEYLIDNIAQEFDAR